MESLETNIVKYIDLQFKYHKFEVIEKIAEIRARLLVKVLLGFMLLTLLIFAGLTLAFYFNEILDSLYKSFGVVTLIYLTATSLLFLLKKTFATVFFNSYLNKNIPTLNTLQLTNSKFQLEKKRLKSSIEIEGLKIEYAIKRVLNPISIVKNLFFGLLNNKHDNYKSPKHADGLSLLGLLSEGRSIWVSVQRIVNRWNK